MVDQSVKQLLEDWESDKEVKIVSMGGLDEYHEACIQIAAFSILKWCIDKELTIDDSSKSEISKRIWLELILTDLKYLGLTEKQFLASTNEAFMFYRHGYDEALKKAQFSRLFTCKKLKLLEIIKKYQDEDVEVHF